MQISFLIEKNPDLHLMKMQISFFLYINKNSNLHLKKMQISFLIEKNSNLHLLKMQIRFLIKKRYDNKQIFEIKKIDLNNKSNMF